MKQRPWQTRNEEPGRAVVSTKSSQKVTQNPKKGLRPSRELVVAGVVAIGVGVGVQYLLDEPAWVGAVSAVSWFFGSLLSMRQTAKRKGLEARVKELEDEISSFPAEEFVRGMSEFGVETILGGADPFGSPNIKLRFPATQLHKHLVDAMIYGTRLEMEKAGKRMTHHNEMFLRIGYEHRAACWIEQMTKGER